MVSNGVAEEPISSELVLVDQALARRARAALPDPPWLVPALAELRERAPVEWAPAPVPQRPARPSDGRRRPSASSVALVVIALAFAGVAALAFVPLSRGPSFVTTPVDQAAPAVPVRPPVIVHPKAPTKPKPTPSRHAAKPRETRSRHAAKPRKTRQRERPAATTRTKRRASQPAAAPKPRALTRAQRVVTWRRYPAAVYYAVYLQHGAKTLFQTRTVRRGAVLPAHLALRPGTYHVVVRPAIPGDAGIILASPIFRKTLRL